MSSVSFGWHDSYTYLQACYLMKNKEKVIVKFKNRKQRNKVIFSQKELISKGEQLRDLQFGPSFFIKESKCFENSSFFTSASN